jgi:7-carboxy-7-deazaguanine synthase (Cx14CxxC type)
LVQEIFATLQGEGAHAGRAAIFLRFSGCNLWSGREQDRAQAACQFCDTDFVSLAGPKAGSYADANLLADTVASLWTGLGGRPYVVCTGGEPLLQLDTALVSALKHRGFEIAIETNGTQIAPEGIDWICVSPKAGTRLRQTRGQELKVVWPQDWDLESLERLDFAHHFLQPMDSPDPALRQANREAAVAKCMERPQWRLSFQTHKALGIA